MLRSLRSRNSSLTLPSSRYRRKIDRISSASSSTMAILPSFISVEGGQTGGHCCRACDSEGDLGQAVIGLAVPGKSVSHHHHPLRLSIPLPDQHRAGSKVGSFLV